MTYVLETWRRPLENKGMRISRPKTQFKDLKFGEGDDQGRELLKIIGEELQRGHHVRYIGSSVEDTGRVAT